MARAALGRFRRNSFFLPVEVLSARVPQHLPNLLTAGLPQGEPTPIPRETRTAGKTGRLREALCHDASKIKWVVYAKAPFGGPEQVLKYLAQYTHRVAISNSRLLSLENRQK